MNSLFHHPSWGDFLLASLLLLIAYYSFIAFKYYPRELRSLLNRLTGKKDPEGELPTALIYQPEITPPTNRDMTLQTHQDLAGESQELAKQLITCISAAIDKPFSPAILLPQLKKILHDFPDVAASTDREIINELIVAECEKTGTALLSESEVDQWWSA